MQDTSQGRRLEHKRPPSGWGSWRVRRRFMMVVCAFCMLVISYCLYYKLDTRVAETAVEMAFITLIGIVGSYVFGAAWQDISTYRPGMGEYGYYQNGFYDRPLDPSGLPPVVPGVDKEK